MTINGPIYSRGTANGTDTVKSYNSRGSRNSTAIVAEQVGYMYPFDEGHRESKVIASTGGTTIVVSGATGLSIEVDNYTVAASGATGVRFLSGSTNITGPMSLSANGSVSATAGNGYLMKTAVGENLSIVSTSTVSGHLSYRMV